MKKGNRAMLYFVVNGVAFDDRQEAQVAADILKATVYPVNAYTELHAVSIAEALKEVDGSGWQQS